MESKMRKKMMYYWNRDHCALHVGIGFEEGFNAACELFMPLLEMSAPHVFASASADHMLDGFSPRRHPIDELVDRIKAVIPDEG